MLNLSTPINELSYGIVGKNILDSLLKNNVEVSLFNIGPISDYDKQKYEKILSKPVIEDAPSLVIFHDHKLDYHREGCGARIGFPIFELDNFSEQSKEQLSQQDLIIVCSGWAQSIINRHLPYLNCKVVKLGVDTGVFHYLPGVNKIDGECVFLNIGKYEVRKGHDILPQIFNTAFPNNEKVKLWMCCDNPFLTKENFQKIRRFYSQELGNRVILLESGLKSESLNYLMNRADCGVYPHRSEGWCLPISESLSAGQQIIATNYSGPTAYLTSQNSYLVSPGKEMVPAVDNVFFDGRVGCWPENNTPEYIQEFAALMRRVYENKMENKKVVNNSGIQTAKELSWDRTARGILEIVTKL